MHKHDQHPSESGLPHDVLGIDKVSKHTTPRQVSAAYNRMIIENGRAVDHMDQSRKQVLQNIDTAFGELHDKYSLRNYIASLDEQNIPPPESNSGFDSKEFVVTLNVELRNRKKLDNLKDEHDDIVVQLYRRLLHIRSSISGRKSEAILKYNDDRQMELDTLRTRYEEITQAANVKIDELMPNTTTSMLVEHNRALAACNLKYDALITQVRVNAQYEHDSLDHECEDEIREENIRYAERKQTILAQINEQIEQELNIT